jgi:hypothetical protein
VTHGRFYWLGVDKPKPRSTIEAEVTGQRIDIRGEALPRLTLRLRDQLIDLDLPITVTVNDVEVFRGTVLRTPGAIERSLDERPDPHTAATATLTIPAD